jgi:murein DD-endopeptidase MepM/ murein hydrolase activator NlpD
MRLSSLICVFAALSVGLSACASTPRDPARVDYRSFDPSNNSRAWSGGCNANGYTVRSGDTLSEIAERCGVDMRALADANNMYSPYTVRAGQTLSMPSGRTAGRAGGRSTSRADAPVHVVQRGENLYRIGRRYDIPYQQIAAHNGLRAPYQLEVGQQIHLPGGSTLAYTPRDARAPDRRTNTRSARLEPAAAGAPRFDWPIRGSIISGFGRKPDGGRNDGINIEASSGAEVQASASGQVVYAGSELAGYGRLVLVRHSGGYVTAYAHNSRLLVREGDQVDRGQVIARAGSSGTVDSTQVHFEIRRGVNPEDPMRHLR